MAFLLRPLFGRAALLVSNITQNNYANAAQSTIFLVIHSRITILYISTTLSKQLCLKEHCSVLKHAHRWFKHNCSSLASGKSPSISSFPEPTDNPQLTQNSVTPSQPKENRTDIDRMHWSRHSSLSSTVSMSRSVRLHV